MANNCLVTKLKGVVDNDNLFKITDLVFELNVYTSTFDHEKVRIVSLTDPSTTDTYRLTGDAYFLDVDKTTNLGQVLQASGDKSFYIISPSEGNKLIISSKGRLTQFKPGYFPLKCYPTAMGNNNLMSVVSWSPVFKVEVNSLLNSGISEVEVHGLYGDISNLPTFNNLRTLSSTSDGGTGLYGDLSKLKGSVDRINCSGNFTWTSNGRSTTLPYIVLDGSVGLGDDVDNYLINSAACLDTTSREKTISIRGNRTSASDAAVNILKSRGATIKINGTVI